MPTLIQNVSIRFGTWMVDSPGSGLLRQTVTVDVVGRATMIVGDMAHALAAALPWGEYGRTVFPWGFPYGVRTDEIPVGAVLLRSGLETVDSYTYGASPDSSRVTVDVLIQPGKDLAFLETLYERMLQVERAIEGMRATTVGVAAGVDWGSADWLSADWL